MAEQKQEIHKVAGLALLRALFFQFWKWTIPFVLSGITAVVGFLQHTSIPLMWIMFAATGVFCFSMMGIDSAARSFSRSTDAHKLRVSNVNLERAKLREEEVLLFAVELENLAPFPLYMECYETGAQVENSVSLTRHNHLTRLTMPPFGKAPFRSAAVLWNENFQKLMTETQTPMTEATLDGKYSVSFRYGARPNAMRRTLVEKYRAMIWLRDGKFRVAFRRDEKNLQAIGEECQ